MKDIGLLEKLCKTCGISGDEKAVANIILDEIRPFADEINVDPMGNVIVFKKGKERAKRKLMLSAHMDEVGFIITDILDNGMLKFECVGGINDSAVFAKQLLVGKDKIPGSVCSTPIHLTDSDGKGKNPPVKTLCIDIGAKNKEEAEKYVRLYLSI